ncbi:MAG: hypothetical protein HY360_02565 [Verrucomicrobia bacterium]|nr:hypothetical protein [Verrucomicrobiota bacterium]
MRFPFNLKRILCVSDGDQVICHAANAEARAFPPLDPLNLRLVLRSRD